jgi:hypothetical protein
VGVPGRRVRKHPFFQIGRVVVAAGALAHPYISHAADIERNAAALLDPVAINLAEQAGGDEYKLSFLEIAERSHDLFEDVRIVRG